MLANTPLFDDLPPEDVADLAEHLKHQHLERGQVVFKQGEPGDSMYLVTEGVVFWRVLVEKTGIVGWVSEVTVDGGTRYLVAGTP